MANRNSSDHSTPGYIVQASLLGVARRGFKPHEFLQKSGIDPKILENPNDRIESSLFANLIRYIWLKMQDEFLGFGSKPSIPGTFATMCQCVLSCQNLSHALKRGARFYCLFDKSPRLSMIELDNKKTLIQLDSSNLDDPDNFFALCIMVLVYRFSSWLIGQRVILINAEFGHPLPNRAESYKELLSCEVTFNSDKTGFVISNKQLAMPLIKNEASLKKFLLQSPLDLVMRPVDSESYSDQVRRLIGKDFSVQTPSLELIADAINVSSQTLRRRLKDEGTSFQDIKDKLRRDLAIYYLNNSDLSVEQLAEKLGFSETSNFHRAFKKWTGSTPRRYRIN